MLVCAMTVNQRIEMIVSTSFLFLFYIWRNRRGSN